MWCGVWDAAACLPVGCCRLCAAGSSGWLRWRVVGCGCGDGCGDGWCCWWRLRVGGSSGANREADTPPAHAPLPATHPPLPAHAPHSPACPLQRRAARADSGRGGAHGGGACRRRGREALCHLRRGGLSSASPSQAWLPAWCIAPLLAALGCWRAAGWLQPAAFALGWRCAGAAPGGIEGRGQAGRQAPWAEPHGPRLCCVVQDDDVVAGDVEAPKPAASATGEHLQPPLGQRAAAQQQPTQHVQLAGTWAA